VTTTLLIPHLIVEIQYEACQHEPLTKKAKEILESYVQYQQFEFNRRKFIQKLQQQLDKCDLEYDKIKAKIDSPELVDELVELVKAKLMRTSQQAQRMIAKPKADLADKINQIGCMKFKKFSKIDPSLYWILNNSQHFEGDFGLICDFAVDFKYFKATLNQVITSKIEFGGLELNQRCLVSAVPYTSDLLLCDLETPEEKTVTVPEAFSFKSYCKSFLLPDNSVCLIGTPTSPSLVQRVFLDNLRVIQYFPNDPDTEHMAYVVFEDAIYAFAGGNDKMSIDTLNLNKHKWSKLPALPFVPQSCFSAVLGDKIFVNLVGNGCYAYSPHINSWKLLKFTSIDFTNQIVLLPSSDQLICVNETNTLTIRLNSVEKTNLPSKLQGKLCSAVSCFKNKLYFTVEKSEYGRGVTKVKCFWDIDKNKLTILS
jgi:hypothetical protein